MHGSISPNFYTNYNDVPWFHQSMNKCWMAEYSGTIRYIKVVEDNNIVDVPIDIEIKMQYTTVIMNSNQYLAYYQDTTNTYNLYSHRHKK